MEQHNTYPNYFFLSEFLEGDLYWLKKDRKESLGSNNQIINPIQKVEKPKVNVDCQLNLDEYKFQGNYKKRFLILIDDPIYTFLRDEDQNFLEKILKAIKFNFDDVAILNIQSVHNQNFEPIYKAFLPAYVIFFGIDMKKLQIKFTIENYEPISRVQTHYIKAHSLQELQKNDMYKIQFWKSLQIVF